MTDPGAAPFDESPARAAHIFGEDCAWLRAHPPLVSCGLWRRALAAAHHGAAKPQPVPFEGRRLGAYFEALVEGQLRCLAPLNVVRGLRFSTLVEGRKQEVELDFLVREPDGQWTHLEVAVKFYLGDTTSGNLRWLGPSRRDSLGRKLTHLTERQSVRLLDPQIVADAETALREAHGVTAQLSRARREFLVHGCLFRRQGTQQQPPAIVTGGVHGTWIYNHERHRMLDDPSSVRVMDKPHWFSCQGKAGLPAEVQRPLLCASGSTRFFVVPDDWDAAS